MDPERPFAPLARRLGFSSLGYRAEGAVNGVTVTLGETHTHDRTRAVSVAATLARPLDLLLSIAFGQSAPRSKTDEHKATGDAELDGWITIWGRGEVERAVALLGPELCQELRALTSVVGVRISDATVEALLDASLPLGAQERALRDVLELGTAVERAARDVPVASALTAAVPSFERFARELDLEITTCPLGLRGLVDGCKVNVFRFMPGSAGDELLLIHVDFPTKLSGDVLLNSHLGARLWPRVRGAFDVLLALGPTPGWLAFGTRFKAARGTLDEVGRAFGDLQAIAAVGGGESFLNVSSERLISGARMRDPHHPPDLALRIRRLVRAANVIHSGATQSGAKPARGWPYR